MRSQGPKEEEKKGEIGFSRIYDDFSVVVFGGSESRESGCLDSRKRHYPCGRFSRVAHFVPGPGWPRWPRQGSGIDISEI